MDLTPTKGKLETLKFSFKWEIPNFCTSCYKVGQEMQSPLFNVNQVEWYIDLYPKGSDEDDKEFISVFLFSNGSKKNKVNFSISILDINNEKYCTIGSFEEFDDLGYGSRKFIKQREVANNKNRILPEDTLRILCEITIDNEKRTSNNRGIKRSRLDANSEMTDENKQSFRVLFDNQTFSDLKIMCASNKCIYAHKAILVSQNEVFQAMLMSHSSDNQNIIEIKDIEYEVLREMIHYIYTGKVDDICKFALKLLAPAQKYLLTDLSVLCEKSLCDNLLVTNALGYFDAANCYGLINLKKMTADYIVSNMKDIVKAPEFENITTLHPNIIVDICKYSASQGE